MLATVLDVVGDVGHLAIQIPVQEAGFHSGNPLGRSMMVRVEFRGVGR